MLIGVVMGSESDWDTMRAATETLTSLRIPYEIKIVSAHRTPDLLFDYAEKAKGRLDAIIAGAGGAAHLPGMLASKTTVPVCGVPVVSSILRGVDSLLSIVQMPPGVTVATFAIGPPGAVNAAIYVAEWLAKTNKEVEETLDRYRWNMMNEVMKKHDFIPPTRH
jgi:5-(carboxyamino)imidazole ribonucleotide mutase